ncbi:hypothetical protein DVA76_18070, partial [Acinetobacter baumannii]
GEQPAATGMVTATSAPNGTNKVNKQKSSILLIPPIAWWLHIQHMTWEQLYIICKRALFSRTYLWIFHCPLLQCRKPF